MTLDTEQSAAELAFERLIGYLTPPIDLTAIDQIPHEPEYLSGKQYEIEDMPLLPEDVRSNGYYAVNQQWLNEYILYGQKWSPRSPIDFHVAGALFILSTIAARRVAIEFGGRRYTSLYTAMVARSSIHAKTTAANLAIELIRKSGFDYLLAAESSTPQKFLSDMAGKVPLSFDQRDAEGQTKIRKRLAFAGKCGWYFGEFGQQVNSMMQSSGFMAEFRGILRQFDDGLDEYENSTISRGDDVVRGPYLALLASMTPDDLKPFAKRGAALWGDGFLARFALITPRKNERSRAPFPEGERRIPPFLMQKLQEWHMRLGDRQAHIIEIPAEKGKPKSYQVETGPFVATTLTVSPRVREMYYQYDNALLDLMEKFNNHDLDGNYVRFPEKALRIAALLASLNGGTTIQEYDWSTGQFIAERWRACLHEAYRQVNEGKQSGRSINEEKVLRIIAGGDTSKREISQRLRKSLKGGLELREILDSLVELDEIEEFKKGWYRIKLPELTE